MKTELIVTTTTETQPELSNAGDTICGVICIVILTLGLLGNIPAIIHFSLDLTNKIYLNEKKLCFDSLFVCISITDALICIGILPIMLSFLEGRDEVFFRSPVFCEIWGVIWTILPYLSIFLVAILSFTRTYTLVSPLKTVRCKYVLGSVAAYIIFLVTRSTVPLLATTYTNTSYTYFPDSVLCQEDVQTVNTYWHVKMISNQIQLLFPIFPVSISAIVSFVVLHAKKRTMDCSRKVAKMQRGATVTILLVTVLYWLCNVPVVVNYMYFHVMYRGGHTYTEMYGTVFMHWYSWPATISLSVGINSLLNPVIYLTRMKRFREFFIKGYQKMTAAENLSVTVRQSTNMIVLSPNNVTFRKLPSRKKDSDIKHKAEIDLEDTKI